MLNSGRFPGLGYLDIRTSYPMPGDRPSCSYRRDNCTESSSLLDRTKNSFQVPRLQRIAPHVWQIRETWPIRATEVGAENSDTELL